MPEPYSEEGYALMGAAFEVHNVQGGGLLEEIYQQSLEIELELRITKHPVPPKGRIEGLLQGQRTRKAIHP